MRTHVVTAVSGAMLVALASGVAPAHANGPAAPLPAGHNAQQDDLPSPITDKHRALRKEAVDQLVRGEAKVVTRGGSQSIAVKDGAGRAQYVEYPTERTDRIFTILSEFGEQTMPAQGGTPGPLHNQIPKPDRSVDNSTYWKADFSRGHYLDLMFSGEVDSFKHFYDKQSSGRLDVEGDVSDWVKLPYNEARYGHNPVSGDGTSKAEGYWAFIKDSGNSWYDQQIASGKTKAEIVAYLKTFDVYDRYDHDGDGDFSEPDGYIDNFQTVHAGEDESGGGGAQGEDAIWAHRWYAFGTDQGKTGPDSNKLGGTQIGDTGIWIGDYTVQGENGGLGVFVHEYGHNLGLPDLYDTAGGDNGTAFWSLMSAGSWLGRGKDAIGDSPGFMGPWEKLQLNWLDRKIVEPGKRPQIVRLGPAHTATRGTPQAAIIPLPPQKITDTYNTPHSGSHEWWSGNDNNTSSSLSTTIDLTSATTASVSAWIEMSSEKDYDFLVAEVSTDGGATWTKIDERSGHAGWAQVTHDLSAYKGSKVDVRFRYQSDGGVNEGGAFIDDLTITVDGSAVTDDVEAETSVWQPKGFSRINGSVTREVDHYYMVENRVYGSYDTNLRVGPYNFGFIDQSKPDQGPLSNKVEHYPYQDGMLVWYVNNAYTDNNTSEHPGAGMALPVDAHPKAILTPEGKPANQRINSYDATFGLEKASPLFLHRFMKPWVIPGSPARPVFDDSDPNRYWDATNEKNSVKVAGSGTKVRVLTPASTGLYIMVSK